MSKPVVASVSLSERSWLGVTADGASVFQGTEEAGFEETWTADSSLQLNVGNAGGVEIAVNGEEAVVLGEDGVVRELTITPESDSDSILQP